MSSRVPKIPERLLWILSNDATRESILGDMEEHFRNICKTSKIKAYFWYWAQACLSIPALVRETIYWSMVMFKNYFKVTIRSLLKHKAYTFINVTGLAIGVACCLLIFLYVQEELSYDNFHQDADKIYRVSTEIDWSGGYEEGAGAQYPVATALLNDYPMVESACRLGIVTQPNPTIRFGENQFTEERFFVADSNFFDFFTVDFVAGDAKKALQQINSVVITEAIAQKYFGELEPIGQLLNFNNQLALQVKGVVKPMPDNSHIKFDLMSTFHLFSNLPRLRQNWFWNAFWTYIKLPNEIAAGELQKQLPGFVQKYFPESIRDGVKLPLQRLSDIHLHSNLRNEIEPNSNIIYVYIFSAIAILILFIACVNFMNLASARSSDRALEVGVRKVLGAQRSNLIRQFLGENILLSLMAVTIAVALADAFLSSFNTMVGKNLDFNLLSDPASLLGLLFIAVLVGLISGSYPALFLSNYQPISVLKKIMSTGSQRFQLRKVLVVGQFVVSIALMIGVGIVYEQLRYIQTKELGFDKEQIIILNERAEINQRFEAFRNDLMTNNNIVDVSRAIGTIPGDPTWTFRFVPENTPREKPKAMHIAYVDYDYLQTMGLKIVEGRDFSKTFPADRNEAFILNETAARELGWENDALDRKLEYFGAGRSDIEKTGRVIGVVKDFHFESLHKKIDPVVLTLVTFRNANPIIRIRSTNVPETIAYLQDKWQEYAGQWPFEYAFLDQNLDKRYKQDSRIGNVIRSFALLAIFIASLGLLGLAAFTAQKKTKEIGVRKVMGASVSSVLLLLCSEFMRLVLVAFVIAAPIAYFSMELWLRNFAYGTSISPYIFVLAGGMAACIAFITVSSQALKAAIANPVDTLRVE